MNEKCRNSLLEVINFIKEDENYKTVIECKRKMQENEEITSKINKIKKLQKEYVKSNFTLEDKLKEIDKLKYELEQIPIYCTYMTSLDEVNKYLSYLKDELDNYFYEKINIVS